MCPRYAQQVRSRLTVKLQSRYDALTLRVFAFRDACEERARQSEGKMMPSLKN